MQKRSRKLTNKILFEQRPKGSEEQAMQASAEEFQVQGMARVKFLTRGKFQVPQGSQCTGVQGSVMRTGARTPRVGDQLPVHLLTVQRP